MELVSFISMEDDPSDLILSFAILHPESENIRSLILMRTPKYELSKNGKLMNGLYFVASM